MTAPGEEAGDGPAPGGRRPTVFVTYFHESDHHKEQVNRLSTCLADGGADVWLDQYADGCRQDWSLWALRLTEADFVVVVASPEYKRIAEGGVVSERGRGAQYEASLLRELLTENRELWLPKILPVVLPGRRVSEIPVFLQPHSATRCEIDALTGEGVEYLMQKMTDLPRDARPKPGRLLAPLAPPPLGRQGRRVAWESTGAVEEALAGLKDAVARQWADEEELRELTERRLSLRWEVTPDTAAAMAGVCWESAGVVSPQSLAGRIDQIGNTFGRVPSRRLVVLGSRGSGKTAVAIRLVRDLLSYRGPGDPVPVLFSVGSWDPAKHRLPDWMAKQLIRDYPGLGRKVRFGTGTSKTLGAALVDTGRIVPVLDGLDEMGQELRGEALAAINRLGPDLPLVVTASTPAYLASVEANGQGLSRAAVVELRPLMAAEVERYLEDLLGSTPAHDAEAPTGRWEPVIRSLRGDPDGDTDPLSRVLRSPLMAWLVRTVYRRPTADPGELCDRERFPDPAAIQRHLLGSLIAALYPSHPIPETKESRFQKLKHEHAERYLAFLARHMSAATTVDLAWWLIPGYRPRVVTVHNFLMGFTVGVASGSMDGPVTALCIGLLTGLVAASRRARARLGARDTDIGRPFAVQLTSHGVWRVLRYVLRSMAAGLPGLAVLAAAAVVFETVPLRGISAVIVGALYLLGIVLAMGACWWHMQRADDSHEVLVPADLRRAADPASVLRSDQASALVGALGIALLAPLCWLAHLDYAVAPVLLFAFGWIVTSAYTRFLFACVLLALRGHLPWRTMAFLQDARRRGVLRQVGAVYQFRHAQLQGRLADIAETG